ncbi:MAG: tannase/feruloyl esterase family alpha/beta hydrolase, partial [Actinobacteria bacterium]|nr:tannase/feruloyl esterase family alpha/beta hydrolase [Actinomycetota bacterium]
MGRPAAARTLAAMATATVLATVVAAPDVAGAQVACPDTSTLDVPGAEYQQVVCLEDLTTRSNPRTDTGASTGAGTRESGSLHSEHTDHVDAPVPGLQIEGWFPDSCDHYQPETNDFMPACDDGMRHNGQFVIRIPNDWDGVHLVVGGTPGLRTQFASDIILSDRVLAKGWAYVSQDKGNTGLNFFRAGDDETGGSRTSWIPGRAVEQWATMMALAADAAVGALQQSHGRSPALTYAAGISNGGYQTRLALERYPDLFDGGVDWEGTLFTPDGPNLYTYIPPILQAYPAARAGDGDAYRKLVHEGRLPPDSEPVWDHHYSIYYGTVASTYRPVVDPEYTNGVA